MSKRHTEENMIWATGMMAVVVLVSLAVWSGVLPWAFFGGVAAALVVYLVTRAWDIAFGVGFAIAALILLLGIVSLVSPGWYQDLI